MELDRGWRTADQGRSELPNAAEWIAREERFRVGLRGGCRVISVVEARRIGREARIVPGRRTPVRLPAAIGSPHQVVLRRGYDIRRTILHDALDRVAESVEVLRANDALCSRRPLKECRINDSVRIVWIKGPARTRAGELVPVGMDNGVRSVS